MRASRFLTADATWRTSSKSTRTRPGSVRFKYNSEIISSTEGYSDRSGAKRASEAINKLAGDAEVEDI